MARLSKSDAELFCTPGEQNANVHQMGGEFTVQAKAASRSQPPQVALASQALLAQEDCALPSLKASFRRVAHAQACQH
jgi:hypothetical protein